MDNLTESKFLMFENEKNNCWLDASVALIAYNRTFKKFVSCTPNSQIKKIISEHDKAVFILNDSDSNIEQRMKTTRETLQGIQTSTLRYLQQFLKCKDGEPDSAFCAVFNLIYQDKSIKEHLNASCMWKKLCMNCGNSSAGYFIKPIITLSKVNSFQPECPTSIYVCSCKTEQEMKIIYKELPSCLIFHFEKGAGDGKKFPLIFTVKERKYQLTGVIILEKSNDSNVNHFITWIRDPSTNMWLDCNDLNTNIVSFSSKQPEWNLKDVYMYVFESFDNLGKVSNEIVADQDQDVENLNVEVIDLSDEAEEAKNASENTNCKNIASKSDQSLKNAETSIVNLIQNSTNDSNTYASKETVAKREDKSTISSNKEHVTNKETEKPSIRDYRNIPISNLRFSVPRNSVFTEFDYESEYESYLIKEKIKDGPKRVDIKTELTHDDSSGTKKINSLDGNKNKEDSSPGKICLTRKDIPSKENHKKKNTAVDLLLGIEHQQSSHADLYKSSDKLNFKSTSSDTIKKLDDVKEHSLSEKTISVQSMVKNTSFVNSELSSIQRNPREEQLARNEQKRQFHSDSEQNYEKKKRKHSIQQLPEHTVGDASAELNKQKNINASSLSNFQKAQRKSETVHYDSSMLQVKKEQTLTEESGEKVLVSFNSDHICDRSGHLSSNATSSEESPHEKSLGRKYYGRHLPKAFVEDKSESEESEICEYDENELQLKMKQTSLKRIENQDASSSKKKKILGANQQAGSSVEADADDSKTASSSKKKKILGANQQAGSSVEAGADDSKTATKKSSGRTSRSENPKYNKRTNEKQVSSNKEQNFKNANGKKCDKTSVGDEDAKKAMERKIKKLVDAVVERTFAAFIEQLIFKCQSAP